MILTSPPHSAQVSISILNTRFNLCAHVIAARRSAGVWSCLSFAILVFLPLPRFAGVTSARCLLFGANTPWKRVRLTLGLGIKATSLEMKSNGSKMTWVVPLRQGVRLKRLLLVQLVAYPAIAGHRQAFGGHRWSCDVTAQTLQLSSFMGFGGNSRMQ